MKGFATVGGFAGEDMLDVSGSRPGCHLPGRRVGIILPIDMLLAGDCDDSDNSEIVDAVPSTFPVLFDFFLLRRPPRNGILFGG